MTASGALAVFTTKRWLQHQHPAGGVGVRASDGGWM